MFRPQPGPALWLYIAGALVVSALALLALQLMPARLRKPLLILITFLSGLFFALEFFWPVGEDGKNFLSAGLTPVADFSQAVGGLTIGLGVYSLALVHMRAIVRQRAGWGFSVALFVAMITICVLGLLSSYRPNRYNQNLYDLLFVGGLQNLNATMFSIIAFYIVSAAYRAFRIRSVEATILLVSALVVMLGQVALGQALTNWLPTQGVAANFRMETLADWILTKVNSPALLAVTFGLGIGSLAASLRLWLSLERGDYFDKEL